MRSDGLFASEFVVKDRGQWFYTIINTLPTDNTFELPLTDEQSGEGVRVYDLYHGVELRKQSAENSSAVVVSVNVEPRGLGAILVTNASEPTADFLSKMQGMTAKPLSKYSTTRNLLQQEIVRSNVSNNSVVSTAESNGMLLVQGAANWWFNVSGVQIEPVAAWTPNSENYGTGVQFPWEHRPWNNHSTRLLIQDFLMDKHPVTNAQYASFLEESGYRPKSLDRFLLHWNNRTTDASDLSSWSIPAGMEPRRACCT